MSMANGVGDIFWRCFSFENEYSIALYGCHHENFSSINLRRLEEKYSYSNYFSFA